MKKINGKDGATWQSLELPNYISIKICFAYKTLFKVEKILKF